MIEASATNDNYSLAICCFLVLGDANGKYLASLSIVLDRSDAKIMN